MIEEDDMAASQLHEFHFIMDRSMKKELKNMDIFKGIGSLSGVIVKVFSLLIPVIRNEHKWGKQRKSRYMPVSINPDEIRDHVHVYFTGEMYRQLKLIHQDLNFYSIAQLLRGFLRFFLDLVKEYEDTIFRELENLYKRWEDEDKKIHLTSSEFIRQLWIILQHFSGQTNLINIYNRQFYPSWVFRL